MERVKKRETEREREIKKEREEEEDLVGWLVGFLKSSSTTRLYRGRAPRQSV